MPKEPINPHLAEALELRRSAASWIETLVAAGVNERTIRTALMQTLWEFSLERVGVEETESWLRRQADYARTTGDEFLRAQRG